MRMYDELINPDLYLDDPLVASFIENLNEPEIDSASDAKLQFLIKEMMAPDDIKELNFKLASDAFEQIQKHGTLLPGFTGFVGPSHPVQLTSDVPQNKSQVQNFLVAGKSLSFIRSCQCMFFSCLQPLIDGKPSFGPNIDANYPWGLLVIGSSLRGNCFLWLSELTTESGEFRISPIERQIKREGQYPYPYSRFFHIADEVEMQEIIKQIPKLVAKSPTILTETETLVNFATTLKALQRFGYDK